MKLPITSTVLDRLGFSPYWDENGTSGTRTLRFSDGTGFLIVELDEMDDENDGYGPERVYRSQQWYFPARFSGAFGGGADIDLYFLADLYDCIELVHPTFIREFCERCKAVNMWPYIKHHLENK